MKKRKALITASFPAPYRIGVFEALSTEYDLDVYFNTCKDENRNPNWFCKTGNINFEVLDNEQANMNFASALKNIKQYDFVFAYDLARSHTLKTIIYCKINKIPYFINNDGAISHKDKFIPWLIKRFAFSGVSLCMGSGQASTNYFKKYGVKEAIIRTHNFTSLSEEDILKSPISDDEKRNLRNKLSLKQDKVYVMTVGQFIERKGFDLLLEAWSKLGGQNAELVIVGGGDDRIKYEAFIAENKLDNVTIIDFLNKKDLYDYYKASDVFILPTREDVWGLVINEAMACGLPVISSDNCVAAQELVKQGENGFIYPVYDIDAMGDCLQKLIDDDVLRNKMAENNIAKIQGNTIENIGKKHIEDIEEWFKNQKR